MDILVLYSSTEGQTKKVAERIASRLRSAGDKATLYNMGSDEKGPTIPAFDAVICAASVHQGYHQESAIGFVAAERDKLALKPSAFISVSLSAALEGGQAEAQSYVDRFLETTGWKPAMTLLLAGAVRLSDYDYFERQVMKYIVMQKGVAHDLDVDYECTDWAALESFVDSLRRLGAPAPGRVAAPNQAVSP